MKELEKIIKTAWLKDHRSMIGDDARSLDAVIRAVELYITPRLQLADEALYNAAMYNSRDSYGYEHISKARRLLGDIVEPFHNTSPL